MHSVSDLTKRPQSEEKPMRRILAIILFAATFFGGIAMAKDPVVGTWTLDVAKSKFSPGPALKSATRTYTESADGLALEGKTVTADGKEASMHVAYKADGKSYPVTGNPDADSVTPKSVDARTWDFTLTKDGKVVGTVHRVVSADGKTLTVHNKGTHNGVPYDDTLVFTRQ
jgi:hypothetical protein